MLRQYENSIDDKRQFTALVKDIFPEEAKNINLILMAYNMGIAQDIQRANLLNNTFAFRYQVYGYGSQSKTLWNGSYFYLRSG